MKALDLRLYLVTDQRLPWNKCVAAVLQAVLGGVTVVQLREKNKSKDEIGARARALLGVLRPMGIPLIVNDHVDVAREVGAQGVHLGKGDFDVRAARKILGPEAIVGLSIENSLDLERSYLEVCNYVSASPVFPTATKEDASEPIGVEGLVRLRAACPIPLVAIGGITERNVKLIVPTGIEGICVVSSILLSPTPGATARNFRRAFSAVEARV